MVGRKMYGGQTSHLPLRVNMSGVIPPIFASSLMMFPAVPKNVSRVRLFVTSEHTREQLDKCAEIILDAAEHFDFSIEAQEELA